MRDAEDIVAIASRVGSSLRRQSERQDLSDSEIVQAIIRVLEHPAKQRLADRLRDLLKGARQ